MSVLFCIANLLEVGREKKKHFLNFMNIKSLPTEMKLNIPIINVKTKKF